MYRLRAKVPEQDLAVLSPEGGVSYLLLHSHTSASAFLVGHFLASIYWPDWISQGDKVKDSLVGPYSVPNALKRAEELCALGKQSRCQYHSGQGIVAAGMGRTTRLQRTGSQLVNSGR
jgi:hypothetical protein